MKMIMSLLSFLGLAPSESDKELIQLVIRSYRNVQVVGRGTIKIDPDEVMKSEEFQRARAKTRKIVTGR